MTLAHAAIGLGLRCARILPPAFAWWLGARIGWCFGGLPGRDQGRARAHLARAFPDRDARWIARIARRTFRHFGGSALWTLATLERDPRRLCRGVAMEGRETMRQLARDARRGQGGMIFTGHFGNWELLGRLGGTYLPLSLVGRRLRHPELDALVTSMRRGDGGQIIYQHEGARPILRALRDGRLVSVLIDQDVPKLNSVFVPWFGTLASTPVGPAQLAVAAGAPCVSIFLLRRAGRWVMHVGPVVRPDRGPDREAAAHALTATMTAYQEALVRRYPEQWVWWHKRWRIRPPGETPTG